MRSTGHRILLALLALQFGVVVPSTARADKPAHAGAGKSEQSQGKGKGKGQSNQAKDVTSSSSVNVRFDDNQRRAAHDYYGAQVRAGNCPPGLAKKNNGCLPPGQAKKWRVGQPLPRDVTYYPVPADMRVRLGTPPAGHQFVRVANDILLIAVGTSMVLDAIEDLGRL